jgi:hypothetical protein
VLPRADEHLEIELATADQLDTFQVGYLTGEDGCSLVCERGGWQPQWLVIGMEVLLGDPVFVDLDDPGLPVFTAMHGQGAWRPELLGGSLEHLLWCAEQ